MQKCFIYLIIMIIITGILEINSKPSITELIIKKSNVCIDTNKIAIRYNHITKRNIDIQTLDDSLKYRYNKYKIDIQKEDNYLFAFPPYPLPAKNHVNFLLYWDISLDIKKDEMAVYDLNGNKICGEEKITLDQINAYSGIITWYPRGIDRGIYLININHGTRTENVKVLIE